VLALGKEILRLATAFFAWAARPHQEEVRAFIDQHLVLFGVEPISKLLQGARQRNPSLRSARARRNEFPISPHSARLAG
jgi:hypothetical protein